MAGHGRAGRWRQMAAACVPGASPVMVVVRVVVPLAASMLQARRSPPLSWPVAGLGKSTLLANNIRGLQKMTDASGCKIKGRNEWREEIGEEIRLGREMWVDHGGTCCLGEADDALEFSAGRMATFPLFYFKSTVYEI